MERRDFKLSSVLIIQILMALILYLLGKILNGPIEESEPSIIYSILALLITILGNVTLAHGLLFNRMGTVSEYLDGIHVINPSNFGVSLLLNVIPTIAMTLIGTVFAASLTVSLLAGNYSGLGSFAFGLIIILVLSTIYYIFTAYQFFVIAENPKMPFGDLFKKVFVVGKNLAGQTVKVFLKWILLPVIIFIVLIVALFGASSGANIGASIFAGILSLVFIVYIVVAYVFFLNQLSLNYLGYKEKNKEEAYQKQVFE
ncbi:hypothetical protein [Anaerococcus provencensis]|uniref:hypothetical protein n=1 Tax=Anaerococcus provencensis TaxID=938293 RepID=UPI00030CF329|nr:hypothetical protein [Anaerococcus provencensis]